MKDRGIIAYGEQADRDRLKAISTAEGRSGSDWIIARIRERYAELFGDLDPGIAASDG